MSSKWVRVGSVRRFDEVKASREQVVKMAEEVMEVFSEWEDIYTVKTWEHAGMTCAMRRGRMGIPCGYVALPDGHPLHGVEYQNMDEWPDVHGGVTWTGVHIGFPELGWLIGFDMGHDGDFECDPGGEMRFIRTDEECVAETNRLAEQMADWGER